MTNRRSIKTSSPRSLVIVTSAALALIAACSTGPKVVARMDAAITTDIQEQIASSPTLSPHNLTVVTTDGVVKLAGRVPMMADRTEVQTLAKATPGVRSVDNSVIFGGTKDAAATVVQ